MKNTTQNSIRPSSFILAGLLLLVAIPAAHAQQGGFEIGVGGGLFEFDDNVGGESEARFDLRAGYFFTDSFELEVQKIAATSIFDLTLDAYLVNGVFHFRTGRTVVPYVLVGAGIANIEFNPLFGSQVDDDGTAFQAAVGTRFYFGDSHRGSWRLELAGLREDSFSQDSTHLGFTGAFSWRFGGK